MPATEFNVNITDEKSSTGTVLVFDVLSSKGPNIDWERTEWMLDGQYSRRGPAARLDIPEAGINTIVPWTCTLYQSGDTPLIKNGQVTVGANFIEPLISVTSLSPDQPHVLKLDVLQTTGINIDWERETGGRRQKIT